MARQEPVRGTRRARRGMWVAVVVAAIAVAALAVTWAALRSPATLPPGPTPTGAVTSSPTQPEPTSTTTSPAEPTPTATTPADPLAGWTLEEKVGQLFVVGLDLTEPQQVSRDLVSQRHVGNVFLHGRSSAGSTAVRAVVDDFTALATDATTHGTPMLVAVDQEGGRVQTLTGPGFSTIPAATAQAGVAPDELRTQAQAWGEELAAAGVTLNLAPVMDLVSSSDAVGNPPIGALDRNYGFDEQTVTSHAGAFLDGMRTAGVGVSVKHFPGLGRVTANTDTTAGVTDTVTAPDDASVDVFRSGIAAGADTVLMSTAVYSLIDPSAPAAFSPVVVGGLLRGTLGFDGVVITDDLSGAEQVAAWSPGDRAIDAIAAGCDLVLFSKEPDAAPAAVEAVVARASSDPDFAARVDESARRVLALKASLGL